MGYMSKYKWYVNGEMDRKNRGSVGEIMRSEKVV